MTTLDHALFILLRRTRPEAVMQAWLSVNENQQLFNPSTNVDLAPPLSLKPDKIQFCNALQAQYPQYSADEAEYLFRYLYEYADKEEFKQLGIFNLIPHAVEDYLITDYNEECLCRHNKLIDFREATHPIDTTIFIAAYLAKNDMMKANKRKIFSWAPIVRTDNIRLHNMLDHGMAENHFHIGGSSNAFMFSWICLMNHYNTDRKQEFQSQNMDRAPLDIISIGSTHANESCYSLTFKASCIRYFLYQKLHDRRILHQDTDEINTDTDADLEWLKKMLKLSENECDLFASELDNMIAATRDSVDQQPFFLDFLPDYAMEDEIFIPRVNNNANIYRIAVRDYERQLYRPISGEQHFLYDLFYAIFKQDARIQPYLDVAYAYLLIYCQIRGELIQVNNRVGFGNFLKYQDRKNTFTEKWPQYDDLRTEVAQQVVIANPQVQAFEGRLCPCDNEEELLDKIKYFIQHAKNIRFHHNINWENLVRQKLHFVLHFPKSKQPITDDESYECMFPRDSKKRESSLQQAHVIIKALKKDPQSMSFVTGLDACSNEIDCRPEVFACALRMLRGHRDLISDKENNIPLVLPKITYHAGEDFLDPIDGLRAIDEAIQFCEMGNGDRFGHALALGIDVADWYRFKNYKVLLSKQILLDNLVWLYGKMQHYNIINTTAGAHIEKHFRKHFTDIYINHLEIPNSILYSCDVMEYFSSLNLRGNDPSFYAKNPDGNPALQKQLNKTILECSESWKISGKTQKNYDHISNTLYHYYHYHYKMKKESSQVVLYQVPQCIVDVVGILQKRMQNDVACQGIAIECNPSSNYLIGTFKDYLKHPIFQFNNKHLFSASDSRSQQYNPYISASINTDDLGIFDTSLENEYALIACALERHNEHCAPEEYIPVDNIYKWLDNIRRNGCEQSFIRLSAGNGPILTVPHLAKDHKYKKRVRF